MNSHTMEISASKSASATPAPVQSTEQVKLASKGDAAPLPATVDTYAFGHFAHLIGKLKAQEQIRADEISRARKLAKDPDWPPARIVQDLARYFVAASKSTQAFEPAVTKLSKTSQSIKHE